MPIIARKAPRNAAARLGAYVTLLLLEKRVPPGMPADINPRALSHSQAHPVYFVPLDQLVKGKLLDAAKQTS
jgi:hypothetical protein